MMMKSKMWLGLAFLVCGACSDETDPAPVLTDSGLPGLIATDSGAPAVSSDASAASPGASTFPTGTTLPGTGVTTPTGTGGAGAGTFPGIPGFDGGIPNIPGLGGATGGADGGAGSTTGGTSTPTTSTGGGTPKLPEISGTCPDFKTGTATIGGVAGITLKVGQKKEGGSLVFYWHGTGSSPGIELASMYPASVQSAITGEGGIIVAFSGSSGSGGDCSGTGTFAKDDFKVADLIAACAVKNHGIDPKRIYTTGCSAGGLHAGCMASLRSSYVAAAVPNSGGVVFPQTIQDKSNIPAVMTMHGGSGDMVIVTFSQTSKTLDDQFKAAGGVVVNCDHGGGHCSAPAALQAAGWEFMKAHPFGTKPSPYAGGLPASFPNYCKML
jgi:predicted esterase